MSVAEQLSESSPGNLTSVKENDWSLGSRWIALEKESYSNEYVKIGVQRKQI